MPMSMLTSNHLGDRCSSRIRWPFMMLFALAVLAGCEVKLTAEDLRALTP